MTILTSTDQVNKRQLKDLDKLLQLCNKKDNGAPPTYPYILRQKRETKNAIFCYRSEKLIGFLSVYFFYEDACEICLMVAPAFRRKGIARRLIKAIKPIVQARGMQKIIFSTTATFGSDWLPNLDLVYQQSEYHMQRLSQEKQTITHAKLTLREANIDDLNILCDIDMACFPKQAIDMNARLTYLLTNQSCTILLAYHQGEIIGKAHIHKREGKINFSDIAIFPAAQNQGFGSELLAHCINRMIDAGKREIVLDVEANNVGALNLYTRQGFVTTNSYDYWIIGVRDLMSKLEI